MSPLVLIVFAPVLLGGFAVVSLFLGAAAAGAWEAVEQHPPSAPDADLPAHLPIAPRETTTPARREWMSHPIGTPPVEGRHVCG